MPELFKVVATLYWLSQQPVNSVVTATEFNRLMYSTGGTPAIANQPVPDSIPEGRILLKATYPSYSTFTGRMK